LNTKNLKIIVTFTVAFMFSFIAFNNITDYHTNLEWIQGILDMQTISSKHLQWRAITNPTLQHVAYLSVIAWEVLTAIVCWVGTFRMLRANDKKGKLIATAGLTMGFLLFMIGFVIIAGEWFYLWDSTFRSMHSKSILLAFLLGTFAFFVSAAPDE
jgi:predicted small integral membrane protein